MNSLLSKGINWSRKEINMLLSKGISNISLKATNGKNWRSKTFNFISLKRLDAGSFWGTPTYADIIDL